MKTHFATVALAAVLPAMSACNPSGSCQYSTTNGYNYCEDYLGTEYNQSVAQNSCSVGSGTWSAKSCDSGGAIGTCSVSIVDTGNSQNVLYTYYPNSSTAGVAAATAPAVETACGLLGGVFTADTLQ